MYNIHRAVACKIWIPYRLSGNFQIIFLFSDEKKVPKIIRKPKLRLVSGTHRGRGFISYMDYAIMHSPGTMHFHCRPAPSHSRGEFLKCLQANDPFMKETPSFSLAWTVMQKDTFMPCLLGNELFIFPGDYYLYLSLYLFSSKYSCVVICEAKEHPNVHCKYAKFFN